MPLRIIKREDSPYWQITGSLNGVRVRQSTGTDSRSEAEKYRLEIEGKILSGKPTSRKTVAHAVVAYIENGGENRFLKAITLTLGNEFLEDLNQEIIDRAARIAYPGYKRGKKGKLRPHSKATIRRQFYTPLLSVLHYAHDLNWMPYIRVKLPKATRPAPSWGDTAWFGKFYEHADENLADLVEFLSTTGCRISEALYLKGKDIVLSSGTAYVRTTKNGEPREVYLTASLCEMLSGFAPDEQCFKYKDRFAVNWRLKQVAAQAGITPLTSHKVGSHSYATNLYRLAGMDAKALTSTGRWKDPKSTYHYVHYLSKEESKKADVLAEKLTQRPNKRIIT